MNRAAEQPMDLSLPRPPAAATGLKAFLVTAKGAVPAADPGAAAALLKQGQYFWLDLVGDDEPARAAFVEQLGFDAGDSTWLQRFGQAGRISLDRVRLRASTWLSEGPGQGLTEIHLLSSRRCVVTAWRGHAGVLDEVRPRLAETLANPQSSPTSATAILLQLILASLHAAVSIVDAELTRFQRQLAEAPDQVDFPAMNLQTRRLQLIWSEVERYSEAVKGALIGLNTATDIDARGAEELASYAEQVEDLESRLKVRSEWGADMMRDYAAAIAHQQSQQISRLTMVSLIFLPITFLTGFFGMNFPWMVKALGGPTAFMGLGLALPVASVTITTIWLSRRLARTSRRGPGGARQ